MRATDLAGVWQLGHDCIGLIISVHPYHPELARLCGDNLTHYLSACRCSLSFQIEDTCCAHIETEQPIGRLNDCLCTVAEQLHLRQHKARAIKAKVIRAFCHHSP